MTSSTDPSETEIYLYNTETRTKELFEPIEDGYVHLYTCGPTVYNFAHIGNFRAYTFEDLLRRTLEYFGYKVTHVMNLTDIDDKTIRSALAQKVSLAEFTQPYIDAFFEDLHTLNIQPAHHYPAATAYIPEMIALIEKLMARDMAYRGGDNSVYFPIRRFPRYGCLSHLHLDELQAGASCRVATDEYDKDHAADFVLWKAYDPERDGDIFWESPFGRGRPGWHIECSAMAMELLGEVIDIHAGGIDNMFPHHENEIAQSEAATGEQFVNVWMHCEHLVVDNKKMSKSYGNFYTIRDLLGRGYTGREIRWMLLQTHYKTPLNFTFQGMDAVRNALGRIDALQRRLEQLSAAAVGDKQPQEKVVVLISQAEERFAAALADDLNISVALAALFDLIRELNAFCDRDELQSASAVAAIAAMRRCDRVLGILDGGAQDEAFPNEVVALLHSRQEARQRKDWAEADRLRDAITDAGYGIEDTSHGPRLHKLVKS